MAESKSSAPAPPQPWLAAPLTVTTAAAASSQACWSSFKPYVPGAPYDRKAYDPTRAWSMLAPRQTVLPVPPPAELPPKLDGHLRFVCVSDTHALHPYFKEGAIPDGDVLLHAGDFSNVGAPSDITSLNEWLGKLPHKHKVVIAGNHDLTFDTENYGELWKNFGHPRKFDSLATKAILTNCIYLEDELVEIDGIKIWGSPWQPEFYNWAFNLLRGEQLDEKWRKIPAGVDILMTHGPPIGHGDLCLPGHHRAGCVDLLRHIQSRIRPRYHVFGHIHEGYGQTQDALGIRYVNPSSCNMRYQRNALNPPIVFDLPIPAAGRGTGVRRAPPAAAEAKTADAAAATPPAAAVAAAAPPTVATASGSGPAGVSGSGSSGAASARGSS